MAGNGAREKKGGDLGVSVIVGKNVRMWNTRVNKRMLCKMKKCKYIIAGRVTCIGHVLYINAICIGCGKLVPEHWCAY